MTVNAHKPVGVSCRLGWTPIGANTGARGLGRDPASAAILSEPLPMLT